MKVNIYIYICPLETKSPVDRDIFLKLLTGATITNIKAKTPKEKANKKLINHDISLLNINLLNI